MTLSSRGVALKATGPWMLTVIIAWLSIGVVEVAVARVSAGAPSVPGAAVEMGILLACATAHIFTIGRLPMLAGPLTPGALLLLVTAGDILTGRGLVQRAYPLSPGDLIVLVVVCGVIGEWIERRMPRVAPLVGVLTAPGWAALFSVEVGYYLGLRSTALHSTIEALPWVVGGLAGVAVFALSFRVLAPFAAAAAAMVLALPLASKTPPPNIASEPRPSILMITVDTLRADDAKTMRIYQTLAQRGVTYTNALAPSGWTLPSMGTIVTGRNPLSHGAYRLSDKWPSHGSLRSDIPTLPEIMKEAGYATSLICTNPNLAENFGFRRGVDHYINLFKDPPTLYFGLRLLDRGPALQPSWPSPYDGSLIVDEALRWLTYRPEGPFFLWVHNLDNHLPYYHVRVDDESPLFETFGATVGKKLTVQMLRMGRLWYNPPIRDALRRLYRDEIEYTDTQMSRLINDMERAGLLDNTVVVLTSDHGEEFLDHGSFEHGHSLYDELVQVPLVVSIPGGPKGEIRGDPVGLIDLVPTFAKLARTDTPEGVTGQPLTEIAPESRARFLHGNLYNHFMDGVVVGDWKLLRINNDNEYQLFHRPTGEQADMSEAHPEIVAEMKALLQNLSAQEGDEPELDVEGLKALGYMD